MSHRLRLWLLFSFVLSACAGPTATPTPTATTLPPSSTPLPTATAPTIAAVTAAPTASPLPPTPTAESVKVEARPEFAPYNEQPVTVKPALQQDPIDPQMGNVLVPLALSPEQLARLAEMGVVASPQKHLEFQEIYLATQESNVPLFITSDALLHTYHLIFDKTLRDMEELSLLPKLQQLNRALAAQTEAQYLALKGTAWEDAARRTWAFVVVGNRLADANAPIPAEVADLVNAELELINAAAGPAPSPIFPLLAFGEDYSQYVPRGHYARNAALTTYFKAMMWYGRMTFRLDDPEDPEIGLTETRMALLLTLAVRDGQPVAQGIVSRVGNAAPTAVTALDMWEQLYDPTAFLIGRSDDLTIREYLAVLDKVYGPQADLKTVADDTRLPDFIAAAQQLPAPRILGLISADYKPIAVTQGLRLMGQRFVPDAYIFQELIHPKVEARLLPSGLDVMAVLGSARAATWLQQQDATTAQADYAAQFASLTQWVNERPRSEWTETAYNGWLYMLRPLVTTVPSEGYPLFMQSTAWQDKQLNTALGSWAELKHDTLLYAKQPYGGLGGGGGGPNPPSPVLAQNYVEPVPEVFARIAALARMTSEGLANSGTQVDDRFEQLAKKAELFQTLAEKELRGEALTEAEQSELRYFGWYLQEVLFWFNDHAPEPEPAAIIADVATDPNSLQVLEVGVGPVHELYVVAPIPQADGALAYTVVRGGVFSYYEFPSTERLTDEAWRTQVITGTPPAQLPFVSGFSVPQAARFDVQQVIYQFQEDWVNMLYYVTSNPAQDLGYLPADYAVPVSDAVKQHTLEVTNAMLARKEYEGRQWINTDYLSLTASGSDTVVVTVRETWQDFLVQYTTPNAFDWYNKPPSGTPVEPITGRRGPYTVDVRYTLQRVSTPCTPIYYPYRACYQWQVVNFEELTPRPAWGSP